MSTLFQPSGTHQPDEPVFAILRLYAPTQAAIDKSWKPDDIEAANKLPHEN
jgi:hypothetical protein